MDIGEANYIHPPKKKEVADRLLYNALNQTYGFEAVDFAGPVIDSLEVTDEGIILIFKNAERGLYTPEKLRDLKLQVKIRCFIPLLPKLCLVEMFL